MAGVFALLHDGGLLQPGFVAGQESPAAETMNVEAAQAAEGAHDAASHGSDSGGHADPVAPVLLGIVLILLFAKIAGDLFERVGMPAVLGELMAGVLLGNANLLLGWTWLDFLQPETDAGQVLKILAGIGVVLLLFQVGLESRVADMLSVGASSMIVAVLGVIAPIILGWGVAWMIIPEQGWETHAFIGATLCATSVGITARVLKDMGRSQDKEARIVLGAAVIDDVLGLIVLAVVTGVIISGTLQIAGIVKIVGFSIGFLAVAMALGALRFPRLLFKLASALRGHGLLLVTALVICFGFAYAANLVGLAPIIGAFAAGLILERAHYEDLETREDHELEHVVAPLASVLVPVFFVEMGIQVDLQSFSNPDVWLLAGAITLVAIIGKQVCALGVLEKGLNRIAVGVGMIPRGEVGLIFANEGARLRTDEGHQVVEPGTFSAVVVMVMLTTLLAPPLLKWALGRKPKPDSVVVNVS